MNDITVGDTVVEAKSVVPNLGGSSELGSVLFFLFRNNSEEKATDSYSSYVLFFGFCIQQNVNSAANFVSFHQRRVVPVLPVGLIFPEIFVSPLSEFEQHMYSSDPRPDTV